MRLLLFLVSLLFSGAAFSGTSPKHEVRAVWLATIGGIDWPHSYYAASQREELRVMLDQLQQAGINTVLFQARVRATTVYPSALEPWDGCVSGTPGRSPGYDPLQFCIEQCHQRGMECHAWVVTLPVGKWNATGCQQLRKRYPGLIRHIGEDGYMDPEQWQTADYLARVCREIVHNYDVDGIHLDYIRYPETWGKKAPATKAKPKKGNGRQKATQRPAAPSQQQPSTTSAAQRRQNITAIVRKIHHAVKSLKPWVKLSCSPIGKSGDLSRYRSGGWNAYNAVYQDAQGWLREGLMDQLYPMQYFRGNNYYPFALDWQERSCGRTIVSGLGIYFLSPREGNWPLQDVCRQMNFARENGIGHCYFRAKFLTDNTKGIYDFVRQFDEAPALIPPMTWVWNQPPTAPTRLDVDHGATADHLSWSGAQNTSRASYLLYNVYASTQPQVDTSEPQNLVATRVMGSTLNIPHSTSRKLYYAVCATDRYGNESQPKQETGTPSQTAPNTNSAMTLVSDNRLLLPPKGATLDADYLAIETLQGQLLMTVPFRGRYANICRLPDGVYRMRSIGRKGVSHGMGFFMVKRK